MAQRTVEHAEQHAADAQSARRRAPRKRAAVKASGPEPDTLKGLTPTTRRAPVAELKNSPPARAARARRAPAAQAVKVPGRPLTKADVVPSIWALAKAEAGGDERRLEIIGPGRVAVHLRPRL